MNTSGKMVCEVINPSDPYSLVTDDFTLAGVAISILGRGQLGLEGPDGQTTPILFGWDAWFEEQGVDLGAYVAANRARLADVLDTVLIGDKRQREDAEAMLAELPPGSRERWLAERHDRRRSSMNDIGGAAKELAKRLRERDREDEAAGGATP